LKTYIHSLNRETDSAFLSDSYYDTFVPNLTWVTNSPLNQGLKTTLTIFWYRDNFNLLLVLRTS